MKRKSTYRKNSVSVTIEGFFVIKQPHRKPLVTGANHLTNKGLNGIINLIGDSYADKQYNYVGTAWAYIISFGDDTVTPTTATMEYLASPVSYFPDAGADVIKTKEADGQYRCVWKSQWFADHFSEDKVIGEVALHINAWRDTGDLTPPIQAYTNYPILYFDAKIVSRVSVADGDFSIYEVNHAKSLTIEYWMRLKMADT